MKLTGENRRLWGITCTSATLSTTKPTWTEPGSNTGFRGGRPAANRLSHGTACPLLLSYIQQQQRVSPDVVFPSQSWSSHRSSSMTFFTQYFFRDSIITHPDNMTGTMQSSELRMFQNMSSGCAVYNRNRSKHVVLHNEWKIVMFGRVSTGFLHIISLYEVHMANQRAFLCLSFNPVQRFLLAFPFQISLAFLLLSHCPCLTVVTGPIRVFVILSIFFSVVVAILQSVTGKGSTCLLTQFLCAFLLHLFIF
jgi:hypothetical protein